jgi:DNA-binding NarL/FixJ family response regulator
LVQGSPGRSRADHPRPLSKRLDVIEQHRCCVKSKKGIMKDLILAEDHDVFRAGVLKLLGTESGIRTVVQCSNPGSATRAVLSNRGFIAIISSAFLPGSPEICVRIRENDGRSIVIANEQESARAFFEQGADGVVHRTASAAMLVDCVRRVSAGEKRVQCPVTNSAVVPENEAVLQMRGKLTPKEMKVLALVTQSYKNREIALRLSCTEQVIKNCLSEVFDKVGVSNRLQLTILATRHPGLAAAVESYAM